MNSEKRDTQMNHPIESYEIMRSLDVKRIARGLQPHRAPRQVVIAMTPKRKFKILIDTTCYGTISGYDNIEDARNYIVTKKMFGKHVTLTSVLAEVGYSELFGECKIVKTLSPTSQTKKVLDRR